MTDSVFLVVAHDHDEVNELGQKHKISLDADGINGITVDNGVARVVSSTVKTARGGEEDSACRAFIDTREGCLRLEARSDEIYISPLYHLALSAKNDEEKKQENSGGVHLQRSTTEFTYSVFLRPGDSIRLGPTAPRLTIATTQALHSSSTKKPGDAYYPLQNTVQVNSSQPDSHSLRFVKGDRNDHDQGQEEKETTEKSDSNVQEVAESMKGPDILVDRSTTFTDSLLRSTSTPTPRASLAQSEKIEDTPALEGGRYYDASGMAMMTTAMTTANTADAGTGIITEDAEVEKDEEKKGEATVNGNDAREGTPAFYTPMPSMSTTTSPEGMTKGVQNGVKGLPVSPSIVKTKTYSQRGRKRSMADTASENRATGVEQQLSDVKVEDRSVMPKVEAGTDADQLPTISESPDIIANSSINDSRKEEAQQQEEGDKAENDDGEFRKKETEITEPNQTTEKQQETPVKKRKLSDKEPKTAQKRSKTNVDHEQQHNKENELPAKVERVSPASKTLSAVSPPVTREVRSNITKNASPKSKKYRPYNGPGFNIAFSNSVVTGKPSLVRFLQSRGCSVVDRVSDKGTDLLCIGQGEVKKTSKLLLALAYDKTIVTDDWVIRSSRAGSLLDPIDFIPHYDPDSKAHLSTSTSPSRTTTSSSPSLPPPSPFAHIRIPIPTNTTTTSNNDSRKNLLAGKSVYFTPALKRDYSKGFVDIQEIVMAVGAKGVVSMPARDITPGPHYIVLALDSDDVDTPILVEKGAVCYCKDLVTTSILRGKLELDSVEFRIDGLQEEKEKGEEQVKAAKARGREKSEKMKMKGKRKEKEKGKGR